VVAPLQALAAARAGAEFVAPYVNRLDAAGGDGVGVVGEIARLLALHALPTRILAASFKTAQQIRAVALAGAHAATIAPDLFEPMIHHPLTDQGLRGFAEDWAAVYGAGRTVLDALAGAGPEADR
jgi:fructose-6-phosphate aldolase 2